ncbi:formate dehydrogenase subunit alpha [Lutimonas zeaxanthinifaciens]|uniref:formate dehydrogenase subunit alpha n=1 Tax=Lutimonas zeaxanthinifaciens TaxID=3060215 RepID=UPI00265CB866|nr:formate dehydrogenase subunit alpha [Lutimonas sp. YSD2104]WKK64755.1 formate dehydrogenase subunit alpha [Lutimonas sp. YSD2104]
MKVYLNDVAHQAKKNETILEFVRRIESLEAIPTMCQDDRLENFGSCRVCSVEVARERNGITKTVASCHTPVFDGAYIYHNTEKIKRLRKNILELVLTDYPSDKVFPEKGKKPTEFQRTIAQIGIPNVRYPKGKNSLDIEKDNSHPYIKSDLAQCINCYRCVRACEEIQGEMVLGMSGRGFATQIIKGFDTNFDLSACVSCGACVQTCPTEALSDKFTTKTLVADETVRTTCTYCGVGCQLDVSVMNGEIKGIQAPVTAEVNEGHTCLKGRFAFQFYNHPDRLKNPLIKKNGKFEVVSWEEAYDFMTEALLKVKKEYGADSIGCISSSRACNEENYLMQKMTRVALNTNNIDGCARVCHAPTAFGMQQAFGTGAATNSIKDLQETDCIMLFGANPTEAHPVTGARIKQLFMKGIPSIVVDPVSTSLAQLATYHLQLRPGTNVALLNMMGHYIVREGLVQKDFIQKYTEQYDSFKDHVLTLDMDELEILTGVSKELVKKAAIAYATAENAMEFHGLGVTEHFQGSKTVMLLSNLAMMTGNIGRSGVGLNPLRGQNNVQGAADMGVQPHQGAGYMDVNDPEVKAYYASKYGISGMPEKEGLKIPEMLEAAIAGKFKALWIMGEDTLMTDPNTLHIRKAMEQLDILIVQELFMSATAEMADVVLPASSYFEKNGTFTNGERRVQRVNKVVDPIGNTKPDGQMIIDMMYRLGYEQPTGPVYDAAKILEEIAEVIPFMKGISWDRLGKNGLQWPVLEDGTDTQIIHQDGNFKRGKGKFHHFDFEETPELVEHRQKYPFILTTARQLEHYNAGTMTRRTDNQELSPMDYLEVNPLDAADKNISAGDSVKIFSDRGSVNIPVKLTYLVKPGVVRTTFHQPEVFINMITGNVGDEFTLTPEYKVVAVDFEKV